MFGNQRDLLTNGNARGGDDRSQGSLIHFPGENIQVGLAEIFESHPGEVEVTIHLGRGGDTDIRAEMFAFPIFQPIGDLLELFINPQLAGEFLGWILFTRLASWWSRQKCFGFYLEKLGCHDKKGRNFISGYRHGFDMSQKLIGDLGEGNGCNLQFRAFN